MGSSVCLSGKVGLSALFLFLRWGFMRRQLALEKVILPVVNNFGYEFVGLEYVPQPKRPVIRLYIDKPGGVTADDCERVNRQVNAILSVEAGVNGDYALEVSSPGLDRLLFTEKQFAEQVGKNVTIRLLVPIDGRKNFTGKLETVQAGQIGLQVDEEKITFPFVDIDRARVVPEW